MIAESVQVVYLIMMLTVIKIVMETVLAKQIMIPAESVQGVIVVMKQIAI